MLIGKVWWVDSAFQGIIKRVNLMDMANKYSRNS